MIRRLLMLLVLCLIARGIASAIAADEFPDDESPAVAEIPGSRLVDLTTADGLREAYGEVMRRSSARYPADLPNLVQEMAAVYGALGRAAGAGAVKSGSTRNESTTQDSPRSGSSRIAYSEAAGMQRALKLRLERQRDRLIRELRQNEKSNSEASKPGRPRVDSSKPARREGSSAKETPDRTSRPADSLSGGGSTAAAAQQLIDLITNTIAPESWEINGGRGRIMFFSPLNVLVIRNTGEAHHQIGGTLEQLRK